MITIPLQGRHIATTGGAGAGEAYFFLNILPDDPCHLQENMPETATGQHDAMS